MDPGLKSVVDREISRGLGVHFDADNPKQISAVFARGEAEGITPQLFRFARENSWDVPDELRTWWRDHIARLALYRRLQIAVRDAFSVPYVVLKGEPLSVTLFNDSMQRTVTDLDVLVDPADVYDAIEQLRFAGFRQIKHHAVRPWAYNQVALRHESHGAILELHWRIAMPHLPSPPAKHLLAQRVEVDGVPVLSDHHNLLLLAHHFFQHAGFTKGLIDLIAATRVWNDSIPLARSEAESLGIKNIFDASLLLVSRRSGARVAHDSKSLALADTLEREDGFLVSVYDTTDAEDFAEKIALCGFLDRTPDRIRSAVRPILFGPHRIGNALGSRFGRNWW